MIPEDVIVVFKQECSAPGCDEVASVGVYVTEPDIGITIELCAKHREPLDPELMRLYHIARQEAVEERDKWLREEEARKEREAREAKERWIVYRAKLSSALADNSDDKLQKLLTDVISSEEQAHYEDRCRAEGHRW